MNDPRSALRFLNLAEASDPALPDIPMQRGIAHLALDEPTEAIAHFRRAEALWASHGNSKRDLAAKMAAEAEKLAASSAVSPEAGPTKGKASPWRDNHPWGVGAQWALGTNRDGWSWSDGSPMAESMQRHEGIAISREAARRIIAEHCVNPRLPAEGSVSYDLRANLSASDHIRRYLADAVVFGTAGFIGGDINARWMGSFAGSWNAKEIDCCSGNAKLIFRVTDQLSMRSLTRIPLVGYESARHPTLGAWLNRPEPRLPRSVLDNDPAGKSGPFGNRRRTITWEESVHFERSSCVQ